MSAITALRSLETAALSTGADRRTLESWTQEVLDELAALRSREVTMKAREQLAEIARRTHELALGDSNDDEIEALQEFRDDALAVLSIAREA